MLRGWCFILVFSGALACTAQGATPVEASHGITPKITQEATQGAMQGASEEPRTLDAFVPADSAVWIEVTKAAQWGPASADDQLGRWLMRVQPIHRFARAWRQMQLMLDLTGSQMVQQYLGTKVILLSPPPPGPQPPRFPRLPRKQPQKFRTPTPSRQGKCWRKRLWSC